MSADPHPLVAELHRALVLEGIEATMHLDTVRAYLGGQWYEFAWTQEYIHGSMARKWGFSVYSAYAGVFYFEPTVERVVAAALRTEVAALAEHLG